ncbi:ATP-binding cassette domain-containing protein [Corynebacterium kroppenstedtii]
MSIEKDNNMASEKIGSQTAIDVADLHKSFAKGKKAEDEVRVLDGVSFTVPSGSIVAFLGHNGAGKTTLVRILSTLITKDSGIVTVFGNDVEKSIDAVRQCIATTGQYAAVDEHLTGKENLVFFGRLRGLNKKSATQRAAELLDQFDLTDAGGRTVSTYSGGMRRRLDIAISLVVVPQLLFLDEPTTGLDPVSRKQLWQLIHTLRDNGMTVVLTTQYLEEAEELADTIYLLHQHQIVASGSPSEMRRSIGGETAVVEFSSEDEASRFASTLSDKANVSGWTVQLLVEDTSQVLVRISEALEDAGLTATSISVAPPTLDDVFFRLGTTHPGEGEQ